MDRIEFAERIASGLGGWFQQIAAQDLQAQVGEDAARMELVRMVSSLRAYVPDTGVRPTNWPTHTKKRVDVAVLGRRSNAQGWYGAIELKWPGKSVDVAATRKSIVEDAVRVAFADTSNMCANFVVLGGTTEALTQLFDTQHNQAPNKEAARQAFCQLFSRNSQAQTGFLSNAHLNSHFPDFGDRVPQTVFNGWSRRLRTELVTSVQAVVGSAVKGTVLVWHCKK